MLVSQHNSSQVILMLFCMWPLFRNWWRWKEWRQTRRQTQEIQNEVRMQSSNDEESGDVPDGQLCVICLMRQRRCAFVPCGHLVCCPQCAISVELDSSPKCPVCRQSIRSSIRIYDSWGMLDRLNWKNV